jgi:hypothetical protein
MKQKIIGLLFAALACATSAAKAEDILTGEKRLACEATMCLSQNHGRPEECKESIKKYFAIKIKNSLGHLDPRKTLEARKNFLKLCPKVDEAIVDSVNTVGDETTGTDPNDNCESIVDPRERRQCEIERCNGRGNEKIPTCELR